MIVIPSPLFTDLFIASGFSMHATILRVSGIIPAFLNIFSVSLRVPDPSSRIMTGSFFIHVAVL